MKTEVTLATSAPATASGEQVGPFVVHLMGNIVLWDWTKRKWGVTHAQTGFSVASGPTKQCCMRAARRLRDIGMDWDFRDTDTCREWARPFMAQIKFIREMCSKGEMA